MKITLLLVGLWLGLSLCRADAQIVKDPLLDYYRQFAVFDFKASPGPLGPYTPQTEIYCFEADFAADGRNSIFITDQGERFGQGDYAWSVYCPVKGGGYRLVTKVYTRIYAGLSGPAYIGYIKEIVRYGAITAIDGGKYGITAQYLDNGEIKTKVIDSATAHANSAYYPKYFSAKANDCRLSIYTLGQLAQKYANLAPKNFVERLGK